MAAMKNYLEHKGTVVIETERLTLRPFKVGDAGDMYRNWASDPEVTRYVTWLPHESEKVSEGVVEGWANGSENEKFYQWAIVLKSIGQVIGTISLLDVDDYFMCCEAGYAIGRAWWGQGITLEALRAVLHFGIHEVGFMRIQARHDIRNVNSGKVMKKAGMTFEGLMRKAVCNGKGEFADVYMYSFVRGDSENSEKMPQTIDTVTDNLI